MRRLSVQHLRFMRQAVVAIRHLPKGWHAVARSHPMLKTNLTEMRELQRDDVAADIYLPKALNDDSKPSTALTSFGPVQQMINAPVALVSIDTPTYVLAVIFWVGFLQGLGNVRLVYDWVRVVRSLQSICIFALGEGTSRTCKSGQLNMPGLPFIISC